MSTDSDPGLRALERLRDSQRAPEPDPDLEARLRARFRPARQRRLRLVPLLAVGLLSGAAFAGLGGIGWLRGWFYSVEVDGVRVEGRVDGAGNRDHVFEGQDGSTTTVRVSRDDLRGEGSRTRIEIDREGAGESLRERSEAVLGAQPRPTRPVQLVFGLTPLFEGRDANERSLSLYALAESDQADADVTLLLEREGGDPERVEELGSGPAWLLSAAERVSVRRTPEGGLLFAREYPPGFEQEFEVALDGPPSSDASTLETPDRRARVHVEGLPPTPQPANPDGDPR